MLAIGMDVHSSKTTAYAVPLDESDMDMRAMAEDFNRSFKNFCSDRTGHAKIASFLDENGYDPFLPKKLTSRQLEIFDLLEVTEEGGRNIVQRRHNAITAMESACGRFAVLTTSGLPWKDLMVQYRQRNEVEYDFSQLQSDLFVGIRGKSVQKSAEGGLLVNFLSLRLSLSLLEMMKSSGITDEMQMPKLMKVMRKLRITCMGGEWRLN